MTCPYCPYLIEVMKNDKLLDTSALYFNEMLEDIPKFILRNIPQIKLFIEAYEKKDPSLIR